MYCFDKLIPSAQSFASSSFLVFVSFMLVAMGRFVSKQSCYAVDFNFQSKQALSPTADRPFVLSSTLVNAFKLKRAVLRRRDSFLPIFQKVASH